MSVTFREPRSIVLRTTDGEVPIQLKYTLDPDKAPDPGSLLPGEVAIALDSTPRKAWVGVPDTIHADEQVLLIGESVLPAGGAQYDVLSKASATDGDVEWRGAGQRPNNNTVIGAGARAGVTTGFNSVAIGTNALATATTGNFSVALGMDALMSNPLSTHNTALGYFALRAFTNAGVGGSGSNTAVGASSLAALVSGTLNTAIGTSAAATVTVADRSVFIGNGCSPQADAQTNQIVVGAGATGAGSNTITLGNADVTALYTSADIYVRNQKIGGFAPSIAWAAGTNPGGTSFFTNNTGRTLNIAAISWIVEEVNGSVATVTVVKAGDGTAIAGGTPIHGVPLNANASAGQIQDITPTLSMTLADGERLGLQASAFSGWNDSVASITVYLEP